MPTSSTGNTAHAAVARFGAMINWRRAVAQNRRIAVELSTYRSKRAPEAIQRPAMASPAAVSPPILAQDLRRRCRAGLAGDHRMLMAGSDTRGTGGSDNRAADRAERECRASLVSIWHRASYRAAGVTTFSRPPHEQAPFSRGRVPVYSCTTAILHYRFDERITSLPGNTIHMA